MKTISDLEAAILGLLYEEPQYGYQLEKTIEGWGLRNWTQIGFSSIYYVLKKLEKKELVTSKLEAVEGKPSRKVFTITSHGREIMKEKVRYLLSWNTKLINPFDLGLAYLNYLEPAEVIHIDIAVLVVIDRGVRLKDREVDYDGLRGVGSVDRCDGDRAGV